MTSCDIEVASSEIAACLLASSSLPHSVMEEVSLELPDEPSTGSLPALNNPLVTMDNSLSHAHTLIQLYCHDYKGILYDIMRALKDYNIQVITSKPNLELSNKFLRGGGIHLF